MPRTQAGTKFQQMQLSGFSRSKILLFLKEENKKSFAYSITF